MRIGPSIPQLIKPLRWIGSAWADLKAFSPEARNDAGYQLWQVQQGDPPDDFKPMSSIGAGVYEIRIHTSKEHRVFYVAKFTEAIYVLHAFEKRTRKTAWRDIELARRRLAQIISERQRAPRTT